MVDSFQAQCQAETMARVTYLQEAISDAIIRIRHEDTDGAVRVLDAALNYRTLPLSYANAPKVQRQ